MTSEQEKLVEENIKLVYYMANKLKKTVMMEFEDLVSACMEGLVKAAIKYDPSKGKFSTLAGRIMESEAIKQDRTWKRKSRECNLGNIRGNGRHYEDKMEEHCIIMASSPSPEGKILKNMIIDQAIMNVAPYFDERDLVILSMLIDDPCVKQQEIADVIGVSQVHTSRLIRRMQGRITKQIEEMMSNGDQSQYC